MTDVTIACVCPVEPKEHDSDTITLRETLDFRSVVAVRKSLSLVETDDPEGQALARMGLLSEAYLMFGIESWTLRNGKPIPVSQGAIRQHLLAHPEQAANVSDVAEGLYNPVALLPLVARASRSSPPTPTDESTSAPTDSSSKRPKRSKRSSTSTTRMADIDPTSASPGGDSNSSQN